MQDRRHLGRRHHDFFNPVERPPEWTSQVLALHARPRRGLPGLMFTFQPDEIKNDVPIQPDAENDMRPRRTTRVGQSPRERNRSIAPSATLLRCAAGTYAGTTGKASKSRIVRPWRWGFCLASGRASINPGPWPPPPPHRRSAASPSSAPAPGEPLWRWPRVRTARAADIGAVGVRSRTSPPRSTRCAETRHSSPMSKFQQACKPTGRSRALPAGDCRSAAARRSRAARQGPSARRSAPHLEPGASLNSVCQGYRTRERQN